MFIRILSVLSLLCIASGTAFCDDAAAAKDSKTSAVQAAQGREQPSSYTVVKGDTLWSIAGKRYNDPWIWQKLWQVNKDSIKNPNVIYPSQVFSTPDKSELNDARAVAAVEPAESQAKTEAVVVAGVQADEVEDTGKASVKEEEPGENEQIQQVNEETAPAAAPLMEVPKQEIQVPAATRAANEDLAAKKYTGSESMVVSRDWTIDGMIAGEKDKKLMIAAGDTVYINLGSDKVKPGTICVVYRRIGRIKDPGEVGENLGVEVRRVGKLEVSDDIGRNVSSAKVIVSYEPIETGDGVKIVTLEQ